MYVYTLDEVKSRFEHYTRERLLNLHTWRRAVFTQATFLLAGAAATTGSSYLGWPKLNHKYSDDNFKAEGHQCIRRCSQSSNAHVSYA